MAVWPLRKRNKKENKMRRLMSRLNRNPSTSAGGPPKRRRRKPISETTSRPKKQPTKPVSRSKNKTGSSTRRRRSIFGR